MNWIKSFFINKVTCPRCLGKGNVDLNDIKRLKKELHWVAGKCAFCDGSGKVDSDLETKVEVSETYLTIDLPKRERTKFINNDKEALLRAEMFKIDTADFIKQVEFLHFKGHLDTFKIVEFCYLTVEEKPSLKDKNDLIDYVKLIIKKRKVLQ